jgi:hypothetical protein
MKLDTKICGVGLLKGFDNNVLNLFYGFIDGMLVTPPRRGGALPPSGGGVVCETGNE